MTKKSTAPTPININLLPTDPFLDSILGKFLVWSLSVGRYLVVFTELIVILSFLSRFKLDRDLTDLNEAVLRQKTIIQSYGDLETEVAAIQQKISYINKNDHRIWDTLQQLESNLPIDIKVSSLNIDDRNLTLEASALSPQSLKYFIDKIASSRPKDNVSLGEVSLDEDGNTILFSIRSSQTLDSKAKVVSPKDTDTKL